MKFKIHCCSSVILTVKLRPLWLQLSLRYWPWLSLSATSDCWSVSYSPFFSFLKTIIFWISQYLRVFCYQLVRCSQTFCEDCFFQTCLLFFTDHMWLNNHNKVVAVYLSNQSLLTVADGCGSTWLYCVKIVPNWKYLTKNILK